MVSSIPYTEITIFLISNLSQSPPRRSSGPHAQRLSEGILSNSSQSAYALRYALDLSCRHQRTGTATDESVGQQMMVSEDVIEELNAMNQMEWVHKMHDIRERAEEIIQSELIYE